MFKNAMKDKKQPVRTSSFWGIRCESGKKYSQIVNQKYHISMAALDPTSVKSGKEVVSLVVERDGSEFLLCNLQKDSVLQVNLNLFFDKGEKVVFSLKGQGIVHLTGYLIKDDNDKSDSPLQSKTLNDSIMLAKDKIKASGGVSKNVQFKKNLSTENDSWKVESKEIATSSKKLFASPPKKNSEKFQTNITGVLEGDDWNVENEEEIATSSKKPFASPLKKNSKFQTNVTGVLEGGDWNVENEEGVSSASPKKNNTSPTKKSASVSPSQKTPQKKLFGAAKQESEDSSEDDDEETSDEDEDAKQLLRFAQKRPISSLEEEEDDDDDEDDDDFEIDSSDESDEEYDLPAKKKPSKDLQSAKKLKAETSTPLSVKKSALKNVTEVIELDDDSKNGDMNSSIGRTPMPKKKSESLQKSASNSSKKAQPSKDKESSDSDSDDEMEVSTDKVKKTDKNKSASQLNASSEAPSSEKKKKKKKKKKKGLADDSTAANESNVSANDSFKAGGGDVSKAQYSKKLPGGIEYDDIRLGIGPEAKKGRLVHVYYTGKLADNKVFDACQPGSKPFTFKLGAGAVIKGWDLAIEGMKVGGKRRIKIPPQMGYKNQRAGPIPPNSTLYFVVELKSLSP